MDEDKDLTIDWSIPTFLVITGASRGLGQTISIEFSKKLCAGSTVVLIARDEDKLMVTHDSVSKNTAVEPQICAIDLSVQDCASFEKILSKFFHENYRQVALVHNAGTLGDISKLSVDCTSSSEIKNYFELNLHSAMFLTSAFLKVFEKCGRKIIINISSLAALKPFQGWNLYCTGKAARDMYFRVLALEEKSVCVLSYAPGPLETDMLSHILQLALPDIRQQFEEAQSQNQILTCEYTTQRLIGILDRAKFNSGDHIDVFDMNY